MNILHRFRDRRDATHRARSIERALRNVRSRAVREEILTIASRQS